MESSFAGNVNESTPADQERYGDMQPDEIEKTVKAWYGHIGRKGGSSRSEKKRQAARESAARARAIREEKRKLGTGK
jgi:hypothetical protein